MSGSSSRDAGFADAEGEAVQRWVRTQLLEATRAYEQYLDSHGGVLDYGESLSPGPPVDLADPKLKQLQDEKADWERVLEAILYGGANGFQTAHGRWTRAGQTWP